MSPLVRTFSAMVAASPQHARREGGSSSRVRRKKSRPSVSHNVTSRSGVRKRVKMYGPAETASTTAAQNPARSPNVRLPSEYVASSSASTPSTSGTRAAQSLTPKTSVADRHRPIHQGRFFQVAHAVDVERGPVVADEQLAGGFSVDGIGVVQQRRRKKDQGCKPRPTAARSKSNGVAWGSGWRVGSNRKQQPLIGRWEGTFSV